MMTCNGLLYSVQIVEWSPGKWWVVQITNRDGSYTPLDGSFNSKTEAEQSETWQDHQ